MSLISSSRGTNGSNLAAWARFGTLSLFGGCLPLWYFWMPLNFLQHVSPMYLGPMGSLWAYIEGMDVPHLLFTGSKWLQYGCLGQIWHFGPLWRTFAPLEYFWMPLNFLQHVCPMYLGPMGSLWAYIEGMDVPHLLFTGSKWLQFGCLGQIWHFGPIWRMFAPLVFLDATEYSAACLSNVFGTHGKTLGMY